MSFVYNNEVIDLLLKKSLGSAYTSSALVPGQENQILPKILNQQLFASPITNKTASNFTWSASSNVAGGGTVKSLSNVAGETEPTSFTYIKKYENIPMTVVAGTNYRAWKPTNSNMISKLENTIIGKSSFPFTLTTNINNYNTIYNTNSSFKPVISNGVLLFLGNIAPDSNSTVSFSEVHIYEGEFGAKSELELNELTNVNVPTPSNGELLQWDAANSQWISGPAAASAIADANIEALNNVNVSHATTNQDDSLIYDKANSQWVAGTPVTTLAGLSDTTITTPSANQSLVYNATNTKWENANLTTTNITDINLTSVANGQALVYDSATSKFVNGLPNLNINNVSDVNITSPADKNVLIYDTATQKWINGLPVLNVNDINDVNTSGLIDGQVLVYNNNTQKWVPGSAAASSVTGVYLRDLQDVDMTNIAQVVPDWTQSHKLAATTGEDNENLGKSVSTIGTWTAVGAPNKAGTFPKEKVGRVFLFKAGTQTQVINSPTDQTNDYYGESLFLTATFLVVGSPGYDDTGSQVLNTGALLIYNYNSGTELYATTANQTLIGTANSYLGYSIDTNGTWMISGAPENITGTSNALKGKAYIYKLDTTWSQKKILTADDGTNGDKFGTAVAINNDYAFVGCETKNSYAGGVYIYKRTSDTVWDALHIVRSKTLAAGDYFGQSISVGGDFLMVGCPKGEYAGTANSTKAGEVFVYKKQSNGTWGDLSGNLGGGEWVEDTTIGGTNIAWFDIASSADGTKLAATIAGSFGAVWISSDTGATWTRKINSGNCQGITMSDDGTKIALCKYGGNIHISSDSGETWTEDTSVGATKNWKGITMSADGTKLAATVNGGNIWTSSNSGATWTEDTSVGATKDWYEIISSADGTKLAATVISGNIWTSSDSGATWTEDTSVGATKNWRGITMSTDGTKLAAVVFNGNIWTSSNSGATWTEVTNTGAAKDWFDITSSADGTKLAATVYDNGNIWTSSDSGATWTEDTSIGATKKWKGITMSANGTKLAAVAFTGNIWTFAEIDPTAGYYENSKLTASDSAVNDHFGCSVDITTQFGVIGARTQGSSYTKAGAAYMISNTGEGYWDHSKKITASDLAIGDEFGISVSIFDRYASVGAWKEEDTGEVDQGSAYLFNLGSPGTNDQFTLIYNSDTGRWSIGKVTASGGGGSGLDSIIGTQAMINANTPNGAQLFWDATNQTWSTNTSNFLPTGDPDQSTPAAGPTWTTSWNGGDNQLAFNSHLVPTSDNSFDIGSPGNKIRDLYVSENSLWIGDAHKITIEGGTMKFRKRDVSKVPASIAAAGGTSAGALASAGVANLSSMKLHHWETYAKTLNMAGGVGNARISDVFANNDTDYADSDNISDKANTNNPTFTGTVTLGQAPTGDLHAATKKYVDDTAGSIDTSTLAPKANPSFTGNVGIGTTSPNEKLHIHGGKLLIIDDANAAGAGTGRILGGHTDNAHAIHFRKGEDGTIDVLDFHEYGKIRFYTGGYLSNQTEKMCILSNGNVGIGTTSPSQKLEVKTGTNYDGIILNNEDGGLLFKAARSSNKLYGYFGLYDGTASAPQGKIIFKNWDHSYINSGYNLGIGTTTPSQKLEVNGTVKATAFQGDGSALTGVITANSPTFTGTPTAPTAAAGTNDNQIATTAFVTTATSNPTFTGNINVAGSGSFRGGSTNTSTVVGVHLGSLANSGDNYGNIQIVADHDHGGWIDWIKSDSGNNDARGRIRYGTHSGGGMQFFTETTERLRITNTGNVGIGTTSPSHGFHTVGNGSGVAATNLSNSVTNARLRFQNASDSTMSKYQGFTGSGASACWYNQISNSDGDTTYGMLLNPFGGNVGIGTTSPGHKLEVNGSVKFGETTVSYLRNHLSTGTGIWFDYANTMRFITSNTEKMIIKPDGKVGIGTTTPQSKLDIFRAVGEASDPDNLAETDGVRFTTTATNGSSTWVWSLGYVGGYHKAGPGPSLNGFPGGILFKTKPANSQDNHVLTTRMVINAAGNVGIGTLDPSQKLEVNGTVKATAFQGDGSALTGVAKQSDIDTAINGLIDSAPGTLNTLNELAASIGDASNFAGTVSNFADVDTVTTAPTDGQALVWDNANSKWKPGSVAAASGGGGGGGGSSGGGFNWTAQDGTKNISDLNLYHGYEITSSGYHNSSTNKGYRPEIAFFVQEGVDSGSWHSLSGKYNANSGNYTGSTSTNGYNGEWIQINFGKKAKVYHYGIRPQSTSTVYHERAPAAYKLFGSNDGSAWTEVHTGSGVASDYGVYGWPMKRNTLSTPATYQYFRLVVNKLVGGGTNSDFLTISYLAFYGAFPEQVDKVAVVSGTNMVNTSFSTQLSLTPPASRPGVEIEPARLVITPTATDSVIELKFSMYCDGDIANIGFRITRNIDGTDVLVAPASNNWEGFLSALHGGEHSTFDTVPTSVTTLWYDEPNTTSEVTYKLWLGHSATSGNATTVYINRTASGTGGNMIETGVSTAAAIEHPKPQQSLTTVTNASQVEGQVLETLAGVCDGRSVTVSSGTYSLENVTAEQDVNASSYGKANGSFISYKPPHGTKQVIYNYYVYITFKDAYEYSDKLCHKIKLDGQFVGDSNVTYRGAGKYGHEEICISYVFDIGEDDIEFGKIPNWDTNKSIEVYVRDYNSGSETMLHRLRYLDGSEGDKGLVKPRIEITAIGTADYDVVQRVVTYKDGQVLETLQGLCDGSAITVSSGTYTMPSLPAHRTDGTNNYSTATYTKDEASEITYKAPPGTNRIEFNFTEYLVHGNHNWTMHSILCIDDVEVANTEYIERPGEASLGGFTFSAIITSNETDLTQSHKYYFKLKHGNTHNFSYMPVEDTGPIWGLQSNDGLVPKLKITAIGRQVAPASAADFKIQKVDTISTPPNNGNMLTWDAAKGRWKPSEFIVENDDGTKNISDLNLYHGYQVSTSSVVDDQTTAEDAFRKTEAYNNSTVKKSAWESAENTYSTSGDYTGSQTTNGYVGEWIQINFNKKVKVYHYHITPIAPRTSTYERYKRAPKEYKVFGSNDGTTWVEVHSGTATTTDYTGSETPTDDQKNRQFVKTNTLSTPATYQYFRLVINKTLGAPSRTAVGLSYLAFYGNFPNERIQTLPVSGTNMVNTTYSTQTNFTVPTSIPGINISGLNLTIKPTATDSIIEIKFNLFFEADEPNICFRITRNIDGTDVLVVPASNVWEGAIQVPYYDNQNNNTPGVLPITWYDEPNTTGEVTYKLWAGSSYSADTKILYVNRTMTLPGQSHHETGISTAAAIEHPKPQSVMSSVNNSTAVEGQVLETLAGKADGSTITVSSGTYTMPTPTIAVNTEIGTSYIKEPASEITYKAPTGTERIIFEFVGLYYYADAGAVINGKFYVDDVEYPGSGSYGHFKKRSGNSMMGQNYFPQMVITSQQYDLTVPHNYYWKIRSETSSHNFKYGYGGSGLFTENTQELKITAIGRAQYDVVQRVVNYKDGQLLETLSGKCKGQSITVSSGTYTLENPTADFSLTDGTTWKDLTGSKINYKPPTGTKQVIYEFSYHHSGDGGSADLHIYRLSIDGTSITNEKGTFRTGGGSQYDNFSTVRFVIDINGIDDLQNNSVSSWNTLKELKMEVSGYSTSYVVNIHRVAHFENSNGSYNGFHGPTLKIQAIGRALAPVGNFKIQDVDTITTPPTNGQALVWNATNLKWQAGNVASGGGGGSGPTNVMGQSFFEILTQQPHKFQADGAYTSSTSELTINWKYDSILLFHDSTVVAKLCFGANAQAKSLPFISQIKIQIRSPDTGNNWTDYQTLTVSSSQDYNTTASLKTLTLPKFTGTPSGGIQTTLSKAGDTNKFDIRVYGINNAENYPNEATRALEYLQVFYLVPNPPSVPIWSSEVAIGSDASISFYYKCAETENIDPNNAGDQSDAFITSAITKYVEIETLAYNNAVSTTEYTDTESVSNKNENETFQITLSGLRAGTKYKYKVQAKNNLADNYSDFSAFRDHSAFTRTPGDNGIGTSVNFGINNSSRTSIRGYIDGTSTVSGSQIYINTAASQKVTPSTTSTQTIQITDPYSSTQHTTNTGYGNYVNGSTGLVTLKVTVDGTLKQTVSYGGFNTTPTDDSGSYTNFIDTIAQSDIYGTTNATKGFRLKGTFALNELSNTHITNTIGAARKTAHTLKYEYDRHADVGGSDASTTHNIYIDTLSGNPGITYTTSLVTVNSVKYTMGIASVDDMTINIVRTYTNCNSAHGFIKGDGHVGYIGAVSKTTYGAQYLTKSANNIDVSTPGSYTQSKSSSGINYTQAFTNGINNDLSETSYAYNLNGTTTGTAQSLKRGSATSNATLNHFHDHNSYANDTTATSKLTLSNLYEITAATISNFGSNMGAIATQAYTSHSTVPQAWTLLYINGGFRTNANFTYPNTSNINYDSVSVNTYSHGTTAYSTAGTSDSNGYKWYCQKFSMSASKSSHNVGGAITDYLNVYGIGGLSSSTMSKIKDAANLDAIGFVQQTVGGSSRIGNLGRAFKSTAVWYAQSGAVSWATQDTSATKANYGAVYEESSTKWGPILDTINGNDDIYIFIGLKNTVSLS